MKLRIQNNAKGERGVYVAHELVFVGAGATQTFDGATAGDVQQAAKNKEFRVQSSEDGKAWEEHSTVELPDAMPFLAVAKGARGESVRYVPLEPGEWYLGTALASEAPDGPAGYEWVKVGGVVAAPEDEAPDYRKPVSTVKVGGGSAFDAGIFVSDLMPDVIAGLADKDVAQLAAIKAAEQATEKPRKGVLNAIEAREKELGSDPFAEPTA